MSVLIFACCKPTRSLSLVRCSLKYASPRFNFFSSSKQGRCTFSVVAETAATTAATSFATTTTTTTATNSSSIFSSSSFSSSSTTNNNGMMTELTKHLLHELTLPLRTRSGGDSTGNDTNDENYRDVQFRKRMALARSITLVESTAAVHREQADLLLTALLRHDNNNNDTDMFLRIGIAGPPGAGKSTLIETFGMYILDQQKKQQQQQQQDNDNHGRNDTSSTCNSTSSSSTAATTSTFVPHKLAVICIDPSSTVTGGSILGDKTRMVRLAAHDRAYVRPSSNGGMAGGLAADTANVVSLCRMAGYDLCIVESVGLGQSEVDIASSVDVLLLVIPPAGGDELQGVKKGIMEVSDIIVINKADGMLLPAARRTAADYRGAIQFLRPRMPVSSEHGNQQWRTPVILTSAYTGTGMDELWTKIVQFHSILIETGELQRKRRDQSEYWMWKHFQHCIVQQIQSNPTLRQHSHDMTNALYSGTITPRVAASQLLTSLMKTT